MVNERHAAVFSRIDLGATAAAAIPLNLTQGGAGYFSLAAIVIAYVAARFEDVTFLR